MVHSEHVSTYFFKWTPILIDLPKTSIPHSRRQRHSIAEKITIVKESFEPNVSIAAVALEHRINANLLRMRPGNTSCQRA